MAHPILFFWLRTTAHWILLPCWLQEGNPTLYVFFVLRKKKYILLMIHSLGWYFMQFLHWGYCGGLNVRVCFSLLKKPLGSI